MSAFVELDSSQVQPFEGPLVAAKHDPLQRNQLVNCPVRFRSLTWGLGILVQLYRTSRTSQHWRLLSLAWDNSLQTCTDEDDVQLYRTANFVNFVNRLGSAVYTELWFKSVK